MFERKTLHAAVMWYSSIAASRRIFVQHTFSQKMSRAMSLEHPWSLTFSFCKHALDSTSEEFFPLFLLHSEMAAGGSLQNGSSVVLEWVDFLWSIWKKILLKTKSHHRLKDLIYSFMKIYWAPTLGQAMCWKFWDKRHHPCSQGNSLSSGDIGK